eukprot:scaffold207349_cov35-Tisochrysis_lutea.AAC.3
MPICNGMFARRLARRICRLTSKRDPTSHSLTRTSLSGRPFHSPSTLPLRLGAKSLKCLPTGSPSTCPWAEDGVGRTDAGLRRSVRSVTAAVRFLSATVRTGLAPQGRARLTGFSSGRMKRKRTVSCEMLVRSPAPYGDGYVSERRLVHERESESAWQKAGGRAKRCLSYQTTRPCGGTRGRGERGRPQGSGACAVNGKEDDSEDYESHARHDDWVELHG